MAKDIIIKVMCDKHRGEGEEIANAETYQVGLEGKLREIDLCERCASAFIDPLQELLAKYGVAVTAAPTIRKKSHRKKVVPPEASEAPASVETIPAIAAPTRELDALGKPRRGKPTDTPRSEVCLWCPADYAAKSGLVKHMEGAHGLPTGYRAVFGDTCPLCGERHPGLGRHLTAAHEGIGISMAFYIAREQGDPHGVVAAVMKKALA